MKQCKRELEDMALCTVKSRQSNLTGGRPKRNSPRVLFCGQSECLIVLGEGASHYKVVPDEKKRYFS